MEVNLRIDKEAIDDLRNNVGAFLGAAKEKLSAAVQQVKDSKDGIKSETNRGVLHLMNAIGIEEITFGERMSRNRETLFEQDRVIVQGVCTVTGEIYSVAVPRDLYLRWQQGEYIQTVFPMLNANQREFIKTGYTPAEWTAVFGDEE